MRLKNNWINGDCLKELKKLPDESVHLVITSPQVWVVSYYDEGEAPVVTVFDNERAATKCYEYFIKYSRHSKVCVDEASVYKLFVEY